MRKILFSIILTLFFVSCGGGKKADQAIKPPSTSDEAIKIYEEALEGMRKGSYLYASKKFSEAEGMLPELVV